MIPLTHRFVKYSTHKFIAFALKIINYSINFICGMYFSIMSNSILINTKPNTW